MEIFWYSWPCVCLFWSLWRKAEISSGDSKDFKLGTSHCRSVALGIKIGPSTAAASPETTVLPKKPQQFLAPTTPECPSYIKQKEAWDRNQLCWRHRSTWIFDRERTRALKLEEKWWNQIGVQKRVPEVHKSGTKRRIISMKCKKNKKLSSCLCC